MITFFGILISREDGFFVKQFWLTAFTLYFEYLITTGYLSCRYLYFSGSLRFYAALLLNILEILKGS